MPVRSALAVLAALSFVACGAGGFPVEVTGETTVPGDPSPLPALLTAFPAIGSFANIDFNSSEEFQNQGVTKDQVESVKPEYIRLKIVSPATQDFSFLEELQFYARTGDEEVLVAEKRNINGLGLKAPNPTLELDVQDVELQPYVTAPSMSIVVRGKGRQPAQDTRLEAAVGVRVRVF